MDGKRCRRQRGITLSAVALGVIGLAGCASSRVESSSTGAATSASGTDSATVVNARNALVTMADLLPGWRAVGLPRETIICGQPNPLASEPRGTAAANFFFGPLNTLSLFERITVTDVPQAKTDFHAEQQAAHACRTWHFAGSDYSISDVNAPPVGDESFTVRLTGRLPFEATWIRVGDVNIKVETGGNVTDAEQQHNVSLALHKVVTNKRPLG